MRPRKLFWHILPANLLVTLAALGAVIFYSEAALRQFYINSRTTELTNRIYLINEQVSSMLAADKEAELNALCRRIGKKSHTRITVIKTTGVVVADSEEYPANMGNHANRPEIITALNGKIGTAMRWSATIGTNMLYVAIPIPRTADQHNTIYILRASMPVSAIDQQLHNIRNNIMAGAIIVSLLATLLAVVVSRRISKPLEELKKQAKRFANEDFSVPLTISPKLLEVEALSRAMSRMAEKIQERLDTIISQRNELQTILYSMVEAVLVVDKNQNIVNINPSASRIFNLSEKSSYGKNIQSLIRNPKLNDLLAQCLESRTPVSGIISLNTSSTTTIGGDSKIFLQSSATSLRQDDPELGAVLVFNNITEIKRLENMRRDFVANVSHELMTPLTSIRGYSETVLDIIKDDPEQSRKFLQIIIRQSDRLQAIVDDLLELARLEQITDEDDISLVRGQLQKIIYQAGEACAINAAEKGVDVIINCPAEIMIEMNARLLEQAVINLLSNAIKYSAGKEVKIICEMKSGEVVVMVKDHGLGIATEHLPRIFERFYRCDKSRSRKAKQGGTGLGLAIVKHIVQLHNGRVQVDSKIGRGSTFIIRLPIRSLPYSNLETA